MDISLHNTARYSPDFAANKSLIRGCILRLKKYTRIWL